MKITDLRPVARVRSLGFPFTAAPVPLGIEPPAGRALGDDYDTDWARRPVARWTRVAAQETLGRAVTTALCRPVVRQIDRLDTLDGPTIFVANHHSHLDTSLIIQSLPRPWRHEIVVAGAADYFFDAPVKAAAAAWAWGAVPMERHKISRRTAERSADLLNAGWSLVVFPEGGRSPDGWGQDHKGGAAWLAVRCQVPVVPIHLDGTNRVLPKGQRMPRPEQVTVTIGDPLAPGDNARRFARDIEAALGATADEAATDWYSARVRAHAGETPSLHGPGVVSWRRMWALQGEADGSVGRSGAVRRSARRSMRDRARGNDPW